MSHAKTTVVINNDLGGGLALQYHCKSGDNNLKAQSLAPGGSSSFRFNPDVFGRTLYFCSFSWQNESHYFDIYVQKRDKEFERWTDAFSPLYFEVNEAMEVMATEEPCDIACTFGNGLLDIEDYPQAKHPYPFNDSVVIYIRHIGPGVCIGQAWQEVVINNDLGGGLALQYHCKSGDNDLGARSLAPGGSWIMVISV
ncbi:unnamed protein product [Microthlaspi erraticum]|uniref:Uncharacterized protein n=1 Tax=Microthlaspi erraticum TaxID=1685480 RepID=A0A6D2JTD7_9BRAS|nr:unnamed protein product [Microthlaspi erraticum]